MELFHKNRRIFFQAHQVSNIVPVVNTDFTNGPGFIYPPEDGEVTITVLKPDNDGTTSKQRDWGVAGDKHQVSFKAKGREFLPVMCLQINAWVPDDAGTSVIGDFKIGY